MGMRQKLVVLVGVCLLTVALAWSVQPTDARQAVTNDGTITGVVTSDSGPEAGVWVIAETTDLPTKFVKSVVTGDGGRYDEE